MKVTRLLGGFCLLVLATASPLSAASPLPTAVVKTSEGDMVIELDSASAPKAVEQFKQFVAEKVYLDSTFDQAPDGNEIQGGKPGPQAAGRSGNGNFSFKKAAPGEFALPHTRGAVVFARTVGSCNPEKACNSTQFCIYTTDKPQNEKEYTAFGRVIEGMDVAEKIKGAIRQDPKNPVKIYQIEWKE